MKTRVLSTFRTNVRPYLVMVGIMLMAAVAMPASASGVTLPTVDPQPIFDGVNSYLPWVFAIFAIPAGIVISFAIAKMIIRAFVGAFSGNLG